ncbi:glycosyltransferase family 2 protein [Microbacterium paulum]
MNDSPRDLVLASDHQFPDDFESVLDDTSTHRSTIGCVIPAYNEEESIADVLAGLLNQTRVPDVIHVVVNNTTDATVKLASQYAGPHEVHTELGEQFTEVFVHDIGKNPDKKVGALNYGYSLVEGYDYLFGVDGDTVADRRAVEYLESEAVSDSRIGGISAIYSIDESPIKGFLAKFLITGQRSQFAAFNLHNLLRGRNMAVLGGQFSIFSTQALRDVMRENRQRTPWGERQRGRRLAAVAADQERRLSDQDQPVRASRRRRHDDPAGARRPAGEVDVRRDRARRGPVSAATRRGSRSTPTCGCGGSSTSTCS